MKTKKLRSTEWFGSLDRDGFLKRSWLRNQGTPDEAFDGRPIIGICNTASELSPCNTHLDEFAEKVKRGVIEAGGYPFEFPVMSVGESIVKPTAMLFRNLISMDVEESIRANPLDGVVLLVGCDKTTPALVMGAASCDIPTIVVSGGPMLNGRFQGGTLGSGTDIWRFAEEVKAGEISVGEFMAAESGMHRSNGSCMTMGTASSMACIMEAMGIALPGNGTIPAVDAHRKLLAQHSGRRIVDMVHQDTKLSDILTREAFENAIRTTAAIGGSTNAVIHLQAIAKRLGVPLTLDDWDEIGRDIPTVVNLMPAGEYLMEDFHYAGGLQVVNKALLAEGNLDGAQKTVSGKTVAENCQDAVNYNEDVIRPRENGLTDNGGIAVLKGNLAPNGCVVKPSAASPELMNHKGRAVVFEDIEDYHAKIEDPDLDIDESCIMVLKNCGPRGYPGMPEVGNMGLPPKVLKKGITDMVRISDGRMSGTAYGTVVLHVAPEAAVGGPLALVKNGDEIEINVDERRIELLVSDEDLEARRKEWRAPPPAMESGYQRLYHDHVEQADQGCDWDILSGKRGVTVTRDSH
jgi:L-arabonate dehydrase